MAAVIILMTLSGFEDVNKAVTAAATTITAAIATVTATFVLTDTAERLRSFLTKRDGAGFFG